MKRLLFAFLLCMHGSVLSYTYKLYNQTRSKLAVKLNIVALPDENLTIDPESYKEVYLGGVRVGACLRAIEVKGLDEPIASLGSKRVEVKGNKCTPEIHFYIQHKNPIYINRPTEQLTIPAHIKSKFPVFKRLPIAKGSGELVIEQESKKSASPS